MKNITEQIEALAEFTYLNERKANDYTEWKHLSDAVRKSYLDDAEHQLTYARDIFSVLGASGESIGSVISSLVKIAGISTSVMLENADLKQKLVSREDAIHDLKKKQKP